LVEPAASDHSLGVCSACLFQETALVDHDPLLSAQVTAHILGDSSKPSVTQATALTHDGHPWAMCLPLQTLGELPPHQALTREAAFFFKGKPPFILTEWRTFSGKFIFGVKEKQASPHKGFLRGTVEEDELQAWTVYTFQVTVRQQHGYLTQRLCEISGCHQ
jgi:hypothetical protein